MLTKNICKQKTQYEHISSWEIMCFNWYWTFHYCDFIMCAMASRITSLIIVYSTVYSGADRRKHLRYASLAIVRWTHRWPVNSPHKGPVTREMIPFNDVTISWKPHGFMTRWHDIDTLSILLAFCEGNLLVICDFPTQRAKIWCFLCC